MAEQGATALANMYGVPSPEQKAAQQQRRRAAMTHEPAATTAAAGQAYQPVTGLGRGPAPVNTEAEFQAGSQAAADAKRRRAAAAAEAYANRPVSDKAAEAAGGQLGDALGLARALDAQRATVRVANKMFDPTQEYIAENRAADEIERDATVEQLAQSEEQADEVARYYNDFAARDLAEQAVASTREAAREERKQAQIDAVRQADVAVSRAADKLAETPGVDAGRWWASRTGAQKFAAVLSQAALGFAGRDPFAHVQAAIRDDIDAQKNAQQVAAASLDGRQGEASNARTLYSEIMADVQDERAADLVLEQARLDSFKRQLGALEAKHGAQMRRPENDKLIADIDRRMAENKLRLDSIQASNVQFTTRTVNTMGPNELAMLKQAAKQGVELSGELTGKAFDLAGQEQQQQAALQSKAQEQAAGTEKEVRAQAIDFGKQVVKMDRGLQLADTILNRYTETGDLAGYGSVRTPWGIGQGHTWGADAQRTQDELGLLSELVTTEITGAVASPSQTALFKRIAAGKASEGEVIEGVRLMKSLFESQKQSLASGYDPQAIELHANTKNVPRGQVNIRGLGGDSNDPTAGGRIRIDE